MTMLKNKHKGILLSIQLCLFLIFFSELLLGSKQLSLTSDEPPHITHGYLMLKTGDTWALSEHRHPPLLNMLAASPLLLQPEQPDPKQIASWDDDFVLFVRAIWPQMGPITRLAFVTRYPNILLSILLLSLVERWTRGLSHPIAAIFAMVLMILDPNLVAHAQLNTTDIGLTFFAFLTIYLANLTDYKKNYLNIIFVGLAMGCAMVTKASGLLLLPVVYIMIFWRRFQQNRSRQTWERKALKSLILYGLFDVATVTFCSTIIIIATYALPHILSNNFHIYSSVADHFVLISSTLSERYRSAFLAGEIKQGGWWWYFPFAFLIKTPIPSLIFIFTTSLIMISQPRKVMRWLSIWLFPLTYLIFAIRSSLNIGYRHLLPIFPYWYIGVGIFIQHLVTGTSGLRQVLPGIKNPKGQTLTIMRLIVVVLIVCQAVDIAFVFPYPLAYFNQFVGGPKNGYRYLVDSNVDWGQSFIALKKYMQQQNISWTWLSYYTWIDPMVYGVKYQPLPPNDKSNTIPQRFNPAPGDYALSATTLQGVMMADPNTFDWFRHRKPIAQPGYGLLVYKIEPHNNTPQWVAQCSSPIKPLTLDDIVAGFGVEDLRIINFDCTQAWMYPQKSSKPGWYIVHREVAILQDAFIDDMLSYSSLSYQQVVPGVLPAFAIYEKIDQQLPAVLPANAIFGQDKLTLTGYILNKDSLKSHNQLDIITRWSVSAVPKRPLSIMLHLFDPQSGETLVGDGLGVPISEWREGDIILQRHQIILPPDLPQGRYDVVVGVYWLDNLERWEPTSQNRIENNSVFITSITLK